MMTKKQWSDLKPGARVVTKTWHIAKPMEDVYYHGTVIRMNANGSQALVRWDGRDHEIWYGRTTLDLELKESVFS